MLSPGSCLFMPWLWWRYSVVISLLVVPLIQVSTVLIENRQPVCRAYLICELKPFHCISPTLSILYSSVMPSKHR